MKISHVTIALLALCLAGFIQPVLVATGSDGYQSVGGDFGRTWLSSSGTSGTQSAAAGTAPAGGKSSSLWGWGVVPKGKVLTGGKLVDQENTTGLTSTDWLQNRTLENTTSNATNSNATNKTAGAVKPHPFVISKTLGPVHQVDSSWNQTSDLDPQADASGLIHGMPAETYDAIGPALDYL